MEDDSKVRNVELTVEIISAYVARNAVRVSDLPDMIMSLHKALGDLGTASVSATVQEKPTPAINPKRSVTNDYIVSLEDGRKLKSMKRYLWKLGMTPDQYRAKWGLPADYPMVAPSYAAKRSSLAKSIGLGRKAAS